MILPFPEIYFLTIPCSARLSKHFFSTRDRRKTNIYIFYQVFFKWPKECLRSIHQEENYYSLAQAPSLAWSFVLTFWCFLWCLCSYANSCEDFCLWGGSCRASEPQSGEICQFHLFWYVGHCKLPKFLLRKVNYINSSNNCPAPPFSYYQIAKKIVRLLWWSSTWRILSKMTFSGCKELLRTTKETFFTNFAHVWAILGVVL